jgi:hypothetical protein
MPTLEDSIKIGETSIEEPKEKLKEPEALEAEPDETGIKAEREEIGPFVSRSWRFLREREFEVKVELQGITARTVTNYGVFFIANRKCKVIEVRERHSTAESTASAATLDIERLTDGTALDSGLAILASTINLKGTADTITKKLTNNNLTSGRRHDTLEIGDALALKDAVTGTLTELSGVCVSVLLQYID